MDSGNSDSFQSSNGGGDEHNSRGGGATISAFINPPATRGGGGLIYNPPPHQPMFNPIIPNYQNLQNNMLLNNNNLDMVWSKTLRSDPNQLFTTIQDSNIQPSSSIQEMMNTNSRTSSSLPLSEHHETHGLPSVQNPNPKKRSRASRRAPTTVLTTDTTNFRAMVQEFTGIPAQPFTSSSSTSYSSSLFSRNIKLDNIFGKPNSSMRSNNNLDYSISLSSQPPPLVSSMFGGSMVDSLLTNVENGYQSLQRSNLFAMQNPILASLIQSNPDKPIFSDNPSIFKPKTHHGLMQNQPSNGVLRDFGSLGQDLVDQNGSLPPLISADPAWWAGGAGGLDDQVRSFGNNTGEFDDFSRNVADRKRLKRMMEDGAVSATSKGMMKTWICSYTE